jgi:hypothetical protein
MTIEEKTSPYPSRAEIHSPSLHSRVRMTKGNLQQAQDERYISSEIAAPSDSAGLIGMARNDSRESIVCHPAWIPASAGMTTEKGKDLL